MLPAIDWRDGVTTARQNLSSISVRSIAYGGDVCPAQKVLVRTAWRTSQVFQDQDRKALVTRARPEQNEQFKGVRLELIFFWLFEKTNYPHPFHSNQANVVRNGVCLPTKWLRKSIALRQTHP